MDTGGYVATQGAMDGVDIKEDTPLYKSLVGPSDKVDEVTQREINLKSAKATKCGCSLKSSCSPRKIMKTTDAVTVISIFPCVRNWGKLMRLRGFQKAPCPKFEAHGDA